MFFGLARNMGSSTGVPGRFQGSDPLGRVPVRKGFGLQPREGCRSWILRGPFEEFLLAEMGLIRDLP